MRVFCGSMFDWCEDHPQVIAELPRLHDLWRRTPWIHWQMLTKRANRIAMSLPSDWGAGYPNVWIGTTIEDMRVAQRADDLRSIPAACRFISYEPAIGPLDDLDLTGIDWVIYGGESGNGFRPENKDWARTMMRKCRDQGIAFFHKQSAGRVSGMNPELDGVLYHEFPNTRFIGTLV